MSNSSRVEGRLDGTGAPAIDDIDRRLLRVLQHDARTSVADLARTVNVSRANAYTRLERLTASGVISGYVAHAVLGAFGVAALLAASPILFEFLRWCGVAYRSEKPSAASARTICNDMSRSVAPSSRAAR